MSAGHSHNDRKGGRRNRKRLAIVLGLVGLYMVAEFIGGLLTNSLALLADAGHMLSDAGALGLSLFALWIAEKPPTAKHSYGFYRTEILAALANGATLVAISIYIFIEAYGRIGEPPEVQGSLMMWIAVGGLVINLVGLRILNAGKGESLNVRGAWLHVLTDALGSIGAIAAGALVWALGWNWADPAASVLIGILVLYSSWSLLKETVSILMEGTPAGIDIDEVRDAIRRTDGVEAVHDLHVWTITSGMTALSAHVQVSDMQTGRNVLKRLQKLLRDQFNIDHITVQLDEADMTEPKLPV